MIRNKVDNSVENKFIAEFCHFDEGEITHETPHRKSPIFVELLV